MHPKPPSGVSALKLGYTGDTILTPGNDLAFVGRASQLQARTMYNTINVLELLCIVVSAWVLVSPCAGRLATLGDGVLCVNEAAVGSVRRCRDG